MKIYSITEAKAKLSQVIEAVLQGEEAIVTKMGKPAVKISIYEPAESSKRLGAMEGQATIPEDFKNWDEEEARFLGLIE